MNASRAGRAKQLDISIGASYIYIDHKDVTAPNDTDYNTFLELSDPELRFMYESLKDYFEK